MLNRKYQILLISFLTMTVFYPSIFAELNSIDDVEMISSLLNMDDWSLKALFLPADAGGLYYRPILYGTFIFDRFAWGAGSTFMHLENVLLHLANGILVFLITRRLLSEDERGTSAIPIVASLCFSLHPIVTEPTNWVSGRTDLLAGIFVLTSAWSLLIYREGQRRSFLFLSVASFVCGILSKEVALLFLPGAFLILVAKGSPDEDLPLFRFLKAHFGKVCLAAVTGAGCLVLFFLLRDGAYVSNSSRIGMTLKFMANDPVHAIFVFLRALGFYCKKMVWPFPLNFAIVEVDPLYELLAMALIPAFVYILWKRTLPSALFLTGLFLIIPSFPIAFNQIAWTPYAERYIYLSSAFVIASSSIYIGRYLKRNGTGSFVKAGVIVVLLVMGVATFQRNITWQTNLTLFTDTAHKSPTFTKPWNQLGIAYFQANDYENAEKYFALASSVFEMNVDERSDLNLAVVLVKQGKIVQAKEVYKNILGNGGDKSEKVVDHYSNFLTARVDEEKDAAKRKTMRGELLSLYQNLYAIKKEPQILYKIGNLKGELGDRRGARSAYLTAYEMLPPEDRYRNIISRQLAATERI